MPVIAAVALGGALGAVLRYEVGGFVSRNVGGAFPWGTFVINIAGSFAIGLLFTLFTERLHVPAWVSAGLLVGVIGGFTTFSTLILETSRLIGAAANALALLNTAGSVVAGLVALYLGVGLARGL